MAMTQAEKEALFAEWNEQAQNAERVRREKLNVSAFQYGGTLMSVELSTPQMKIDRNTKEPILDAKGQPTFWDAIYFCELAHLGSSRKFVVSLDLGKDLEKGMDYLFEGDLIDVDNKLKVKTITKL